MEGLVLRHWLTLHGVVIVLGLVVYVTVARAFPQRRDPSAAIAWVVALVLVPYLALPMYIMVGSRKLLLRDLPVHTAARRPALQDLADDTGHWARRLAFAMGLADAATYEHVDVHRDGHAALLALRDVIASAKRRLDVCTFILSADRLGEEVAALLQQRAREGVHVRLLVDGVGALLGGRIDLESLRRAGVKVVKFVPPFRAILRGRANLRNHRKMVVADGQRLWCGGRNFAAEYFEGECYEGKNLEGENLEGDATRTHAWHDLSFDLTGTVAIEASRQFGRDWAYATRVAADEDLGLLAPIAEVFEPSKPPMLPPDEAINRGEARIAGRSARRPTSRCVAAHDPRGDAIAPACRRCRDAQRPHSGGDERRHRADAGRPRAAARAIRAERARPGRRHGAADAGLGLLHGARSHPRRHPLLRSRRDAAAGTHAGGKARRGRRSGAAWRSNHRMADIARNRPLRELVSSGARVWLVPHMLHAKAIVIDDSFALAGSANLDARSLFLNYEMMVAFYEADDVRRFAAWIDHERESAVAYRAEAPGLARDLAEGLLLWLAFQL